MKPLPYLCCLAALALVGCSHQAAEPPAAAASAKPVEEAPPLEVRVQPAESQAMPRFLRVTGELKGAHQALVAADASGKVVEAPVERGMAVKKGSVLIKLDDRGAKLSLQEAEATLAETKLKTDWQHRELARNEPLAKTKAISDADYQRFKVDVAAAEAGLAAAVARRDQAQKALDDTQIRAPFDGTVAERLTEAGEFVSTSSQVVDLVATQTLRLQLYIPETAVGGIKQGQQVEFMVPAQPGRNFTGVVKHVGASVRESARDLIIEAEVANEDQQLKPGMFAEGRLLLPEEKVLTVPLTAVKTEGPTRRVFVVKDGQVVERLVEVGESRGDRVEIRQGVEAGDMVIVSPGPGAADGAKVKLTAQL